MDPSVSAILEPQFGSAAPSFQVLALLALIFIDRPIKSTSGQIYETESAYNYIQVLEKDGYRMLRLNEGQGIHSQWHPTQIAYGRTWDFFLAAPS